MFFRESFGYHQWSDNRRSGKSGDELAQELGIPVPVIIMFVMVALIAILMKKTKFGTSIYAIGGSENAAIASGINTGRTKRLIFTLSGKLW